MRALIALVALLLPAAAFAGDYAERTLVGFSADGAYFAFIEHGVQDGSGWPYANAYVIDTAKDEWVAGTPVRILIKEEADTDEAAFKQASAGIAPLVKKLKITAPATIVADNPLTELGIDPHWMAFVPFMITPLSRGNGYELIIREREMPAPDCPVMVDPFRGFRLVLKGLDGIPRTIHDDSGPIPASRKCPTEYGISAVVVAPNLTVAVALIDVFSVGFEGPDRRFIAVPFALEAR